jgi:uncharacterized protein YutE (UPF0331/DUF86 family)
VVRRDVAARKIAAAAARLDQVDELLSRSREEFLGNVQSRDLATFYLFLAIQECIDLAAHWVADAGWPASDDAASTFDLLADHGVVDLEMANAMRGAVGLRNRIAHGYTALEHGRLFDESRHGVATLRRFLVVSADKAGV